MKPTQTPLIDKILREWWVERFQSTTKGEFIKLTKITGEDYNQLLVNLKSVIAEAIDKILKSDWMDEGFYDRRIGKIESLEKLKQKLGISAEGEKK